MNRLFAFFIVCTLLGGCSEPTTTQLRVAVTEKQFEQVLVVTGQIKAGESTSVSTSSGRGISIIKWLIPDNTMVKKGDLIARLETSSAQADVEENRLSQKAELARSRNELAPYDRRNIEISIDQDVVEHELTLIRDFSSASEEVYSRIEQIDNARNEEYTEARGEFLEWDGSSNTQRKNSAVMLAELDAKSANRNLRRAKNAVNTGEILAPHDGIITLLPNRFSGKIYRTGEMAWGSATLAELPDFNSLIGEVWVLASDAVGLDVGDQASIEMQSSNGDVINAAVKSVSQLAVRRPNYHGKWFKVQLEFESNGLSSGDLYGRSFRGSIITEPTESALVIPIAAIDTTGGQSVVRVISKTGTEERSVKLGRYGLAEVEVLSGLVAGEEVVL